MQYGAKRSAHSFATGPVMADPVKNDRRKRIEKKNISMKSMFNTGLINSFPCHRNPTPSYLTANFQVLFPFQFKENIQHMSIRTLHSLFLFEKKKNHVQLQPGFVNWPTTSAQW